MVRVLGQGWIERVPWAHETSRRGVVTEWSRASRFRLMQAAAQALWPGSDWLLVTLTYPGAFGDSWVRWKRDLRTFRERWERSYGPTSAMWVMEFQRRGAVHWHLVIRAPARGRLPLWRRWVSLAWYEVVGSGDERHLRAGTNVVPADARGAANYLRSELGKRSQKRLPEGLEHGAGRWWGVWRLERPAVEVGLSEREAYRVRRVLRRLARSRGYAARPSRRSGMMAFQNESAAGFALMALVGRLLAQWSGSA